MPYFANFETGLVTGSLLVLVAYHLHLNYVNKNNPTETAFGRNARTRAVWMQAVMERNRDILAIQTLRNWTMAASFLASTAILIALAVLNVALNAEKSTEVSQLLNYLGMRGFYVAIPLTLWQVGPLWLFAGAVILVVILHRLDRTG